MTTHFLKNLWSYLRRISWKDYIRNHIPVCILYLSILLTTAGLSLSYIINPFFIVYLLDYTPLYFIRSIYFLLGAAHFGAGLYKIRSDHNLLVILLHFAGLSLALIYGFGMDTKTFPGIHIGYHHMSYGLYFLLYLNCPGTRTISIILGVLPINDEINNYNELGLWDYRNCNYGYDNWVTDYWWAFVIVSFASTAIELTYKSVIAAWKNRNSYVLLTPV